MMASPRDWKNVGLKEEFALSSLTVPFDFVTDIIVVHDEAPGIIN